MKNPSTLIEAICQQTGISKRDLAILIGGHQSNISRYQKGERDLPTNNLLEMNDLYALLPLMEEVPLPEIPTEEKSALLERAANCKASSILLQHQLKGMKAMARQCQMAQKMAEKLLLNEGISPQKRNWAEMVKLAAGKKMRHCDRLEQNRLAIKISLLAKEAALYKKLVRTGEIKLR